MSGCIITRETETINVRILRHHILNLPRYKNRQVLLSSVFSDMLLLSAVRHLRSRCGRAASVLSVETWSNRFHSSPGRLAQSPTVFQGSWPATLEQAVILKQSWTALTPERCCAWSRCSSRPLAQIWGVCPRARPLPWPSGWPEPFRLFQVMILFKFKYTSFYLSLLFCGELPEYLVLSRHRNVL
jgi:hypothetical protein